MAQEKRKKASEHAMANKPNKRTASASTVNANSSTTPASSLLHSLRTRSQAFMAPMSLNGFNLIPLQAPSSQVVDYLLITSSNSQAPVFKITGTAVSINAGPFHAPLNRSQHGITKLDGYIVRVSMTAQSFNTVKANLNVLKNLWCTHPDALPTIFDSNKLMDPEHLNANQEVPFEIYGIRTPNELLFSKAVAGPTETSTDNPVEAYLPDPASPYVQQLKKPQQFFFKPVIPLLNQETGDVLHQSSKVKCGYIGLRRESVYFAGAGTATRCMKMPCLWKTRGHGHYRH